MSCGVGAVEFTLAILKAHIAMDTSTVVNMLIALTAIISAVYAHLCQVPDDCVEPARRRSARVIPD